jgi:transcriptional regulator with XRE-family HTH domain
MSSDKGQKKQIGLRLRSLREKAGLIQAEVADAIDSTRDSISNYETGRANPKPKDLTALSELFRTSIDYILGKTDDPENPKMNPRESEEKELTDKLLDKLKYVVDDENCFLEYLREDIFKAISDNLYMAYAYHNASDNNYFIKLFTEYFSSLGEKAEKEHNEASEEFNKAYNYANVKKVLELTDKEHKELFLSQIQKLIEKHDIKNPDPLANERELVSAIVLSDEKSLSDSVIIVDGVRLNDRQKRKLLAMVRLDLQSDSE